MSSITSYFKKIRALAGDKSGAALPEFAVAIFPLLLMFFVFIQVVTMFSAHLILHHAAWMAARCGIVQKGPKLPGDYVKNKTKDDDKGDAETICGHAAIDATGTFYHTTLFNITVAYQFTPGDTSDTPDGHQGQYSDLTTTVTGDYKCVGPIISTKVICPNGTRKLKVAMKLPHEGAVYTLDDNRNGG